MTLVFSDGRVFDANLNFLKDCLHLIDVRLDEIFNTTCPDPDSFGLYDEADHLVGWGFVACQTYLTATLADQGLSKREFLNRGPQHSCGRTMTELINAVANYWKHNYEWTHDDTSARRERTLESLEALELVSQSYHLVEILSKLVEPEPLLFRNLVPYLEEWRDEVMKASKVCSGLEPQ